MHMIVAPVIALMLVSFVVLAYMYVRRFQYVYVVLRAVHGFIHCTVNFVPLRFITYALSSIVLWVMVGNLPYWCSNNVPQLKH